jgi:hypothetical protein
MASSASKGLTLSISLPSSLHSSKGRKSTRMASCWPIFSAVPPSRSKSRRRRALPCAARPPPRGREEIARRLEGEDQQREQAHRPEDDAPHPNLRQHHRAAARQRLRTGCARQASAARQRGRHPRLLGALDALARHRRLGHRCTL